MSVRGESAEMKGPTPVAVRFETFPDTQPIDLLSRCPFPAHCPDPIDRVSDHRYVEKRGAHLGQSSHHVIRRRSDVAGDSIEASFRNCRLLLRRLDTLQPISVINARSRTRELKRRT